MTVSSEIIYLMSVSNYTYEYSILVLLVIKNPNSNIGPTFKAVLPRNQNAFYEELRKNIQLFKDKVCQIFTLF